MVSFILSNNLKNMQNHRALLLWCVFALSSQNIYWVCAVFIILFSSQGKLGKLLWKILVSHLSGGNEDIGESDLLCLR